MKTRVVSAEEWTAKTLRASDYLGVERGAPRTRWFARGGGVKRIGPFVSQVKAVQAVMGLDGEPVDGAFVWPEETREKLPGKQRKT